MTRRQLDRAVRSRAHDRCEYCLVPQAAFVRRHHIEHIMARQHGGPTALENLALACWSCNLYKGPNLSGFDPTSNSVARLFHSRRDVWSDHFLLAADRTVPEQPGIVIEGRTATGRATVLVLKMNDGYRRCVRHELMLEGLYDAPIL